MKTADRKKFVKIRSRMTSCRRLLGEVNCHLRKDYDKLVKCSLLNSYRMSAFKRKHDDFRAFTKGLVI